MPPRKAASAVEDDGCSTLKLIMEKGPLSGQTNDFKPETRIQIGRVVRGNTLTIKDAGISTKHLLIQAEPVIGGRRRWTVADLGSSNGTFLNGKRLEPSEPAALSDDDVIIIGEQTSIRVRFEANAGEIEVNTKNVRRNARRGVRKQVEELGVIDEDSEIGLGIGNPKINLGSGLRNEKHVVLENEGGESGVVNEKNRRGRPTTRGSKAGELENGSKEEITTMGSVSLRRTRFSKKDEKSENLTIDIDEDERKNDKAAEIETKEVRNVGTRRTRSSKKDKNLLKDVNMDGDEDLEPSGVKGNERVSVRRTSSRKDENTDDLLIDLSVIDGKRTRKGTRGRKNQTMEPPLGETEKEELNLEQKVCDEEKPTSEDGADELVERVNSGRETATAFASTSTFGVEEGEVEVENGEVVADLEKMTLGEWFDFLEVYLPKQIVDETEEMISEMRRKAERLHEFMSQQKKGIETSDVATDEKTD